MKYIDLYKHLKQIVNYNDDEIIIDANLAIRNFNFESEFKNILPGGGVIMMNMNIFHHSQRISNRTLFRKC